MRAPPAGLCGRRLPLRLICRSPAFKPGAALCSTPLCRRRSTQSSNQKTDTTADPSRKLLWLLISSPPNLYPAEMGQNLGGSASFLNWQLAAIYGLFVRGLAIFKGRPCVLPPGLRRSGRICRRSKCRLDDSRQDARHNSAAIGAVARKFVPLFLPALPVKWHFRAQSGPGEHRG